MAQALRLARRAEGHVEPNPMVGCVLVRGGRVIGRGYHHRFGGPHAEVAALASCGGRARGSTAYVTLEPCSHFGKTPPCVDALIAAGVAEVVAALPDPNPMVRGRGLRKLRAAGIGVRTGVAAAAAAELLAPFATVVRLHRPYVIAKWAQDADGGMTRPSGVSPWISCPASRRWVHRLRARVDAIGVGVGTVLTDDPLLTARNVPTRRRATRVVFDTRLRIPLACRLVKTASETETLVFASRKSARSKKARQLIDRRLTIIGCPLHGKRLDIGACLRELGKRGVTNLVVEGGPMLLRSLLKAQLADEIVLFQAPARRRSREAMRAGSRIGASSRGLSDLMAHIGEHRIRTTRSGTDWMHRFWLRDPLRLWKRAQRPSSAPARR